MEYLKITSRGDAESIPEELWSLVCERSSYSKVRRQGCIRTLGKQVGGFVSTGAMIVQIKDFKSVHGVYWITLTLSDGSEHHAPLGQYFDIFLVPQSTVST